MAVNQFPRNFRSWVNIDATPPDFKLDAGTFGLAIKATAYGTVTLQQLILDGNSPSNTWVAVGAAIAADGYTVYQLPAGTYRLAMAGGVATLFGQIALIRKGRD